ncbi:MAG: B12-binding domain-containing radical SAM protein [Planctomycetes bacterium]|nr:B12-binding domain-containing radical SAM protein [Planctomycetota bacterium]
MTPRGATSAPGEMAQEGVCLVIPPSGFLLDERVFVSLGVLRVAAVLEERGVPVDVVDLSGVENPGEALASYAARSARRWYGFTATTPQLPAAVDLAATVRQARPGARLVLGGPHATLVHSAWRRERRSDVVGRAHEALRRLQEAFDVVVAGDGELAVFRTLGAEAPRLVDADDPRGGLFMSEAAYGESPFPARHLVDLDSYRYSIEGHRATSLISQLGCPFGCGFCGGRLTNAFRRVRTRSVEGVVAELEELHRDHGYTGFMFYDDELNVSPQMVALMRAITALQRRLGVEFRLRGFVKAELFTDAQAEAMHEAGFRWVLAGFEAGSPRILENIGKRATREDNTRAVAIARRHGLKVKALMSVGHPGETAGTVGDLRDWLLEVRPDDFDCTIITTYPGTPYYDEARPHPALRGVWTYTQPRTGDRLHAVAVDYSRVADYYKGRPGGGYRAYVYTDELGAEDLVRLRDRVEEEVRERLAIPYNPSGAARRYEHSMGQLGPVLPPFILRTSPGRAAGRVDARAS